MKASYKSRVIGSIVVLIVLVGILVIVLNRRQSSPDRLAVNDLTNQVLTLPIMHDKTSTAAGAGYSQKSQQINQTDSVDEEHSAFIEPAAQSELKPTEPEVVVQPHKPELVSYTMIAKHSVATSVSQIVLQVASFGSMYNANLMRDNLRAAGYMPHIYPVRVQGKTWYRLSAGPFPTIARAHQVQHEIKRKWNLRAQLKELR